MKLEIERNYHNVSDRNKELFNMAIDAMEKVISHKSFLDCLYEEIENSNGLEGELSIWRHSTVKEIFYNLFDKNDYMGSLGIALEVYTYYTASNVIGYGTAANRNINVNTKYLNTYSPGNLYDIRAVGSNLLHEHGHDCGYEHDFKATARRPNSIAYILGRAYQKAFSKVYGIEYKEPVKYVPWYKRIFKWPW